VFVRGRYSHEPDYLSRGTGFSTALSLNQRSSVIALNGYFLRDDVGKVIRMAPANDPTHLTTAQRQHMGDLNALSLGLSLDQVLTRTLTLTLGYDAARLSGYTSNPYRVVAFQDGGGAPEHHPELRLRGAGYLWAAQYITATRSAIRVGYRIYRDSWDILAHTPEIRFHQEIGRYLELRFRYRFYTQTSSFFYRPQRNNRSEH
jgi:hypothetical protein